MIFIPKKQYEEDMELIFKALIDIDDKLIKLLKPKSPKVFFYNKKKKK